MIICGIDPGYDRIGYGFLDISSQKPSVLSYGLISTNKKNNLCQRLLELGSDFSSLLEKYQPKHIFIEQLFMGRNTTTVLPVAEARGVLKYLITKNNIPITEIAPTTVKKHITGHGRADKTQMIRAIMFLLDLKEAPSPDDVADALAIAFAGQFQDDFIKQYKI